MIVCTAHGTVDVAVDAMQRGAFDFLTKPISLDVLQQTVQLAITAPGRGPVILGDPAEWRQVLFNLLRNALDASPRGGTVRVACQQQGGEVTLTVADEGPGIAASDLDRVFEPFFTTKPPGKGTGLGLAIVHRIVTGHGGHIAIAGEGGATIRITVPGAERR